MAYLCLFLSVSALLAHAIGRPELTALGKVPTMEPATAAALLGISLGWITGAKQTGAKIAAALCAYSLARYLMPWLPIGPMSPKTVLAVGCTSYAILQKNKNKNVSGVALGAASGLSASSLLNILFGEPNRYFAEGLGVSAPAGLSISAVSVSIGLRILKLHGTGKWIATSCAVFVLVLLATNQTSSPYGLVALALLCASAGFLSASKLATPGLDSSNFSGAVLDSMTSGVMIESHNRRLLDCNSTFPKMFGLGTKDRILGKDCGVLREKAKHAFLDPDGFVQRIDFLIENRARARDQLIAADGRFLEREYIPVWDEQLYIGHLWIYRDVTEHMSASCKDSATGLYNRNGFELFAPQYLNLAKRRSENLFLVYCDVNELKKTNDSIGHWAGDLLIKSAAAAFRATFRESDLCCRIGGDEFIALVMCSNETSACIRKRLQANTSEHQTPMFSLSMAVGIAKWRGEALQELVNRADRLMYSDKHKEESTQDLIEFPSPMIRARGDGSGD